MKKLIKILLIMIFICPFSVFAANKYELQIVNNTSTKDLENNQGYISKSIVSSDSTIGEVTIELKLSNQLKNVVTSINPNYNYEIFLVIDSSGSMYETISTGETREGAVYNASKELAKNLLSTYTNVKIGVIKYGDTSEKMCDLTNDYSIVENAINMDDSAGATTNIESGLILANENFSTSNTNKIIVLLTDGAPNDKVTSVDANGHTLTADEATKNKLIELNNQGIHIISLLTEIEDTNSAEYIFGTPEKPTVGKYYYIADSDIKKVISENIYSDISSIVTAKPIKNIVITDYFPEEILSNFEFSYVENPKLGTVTSSIDEATKSITWTIDQINDTENATLKYKLKIKDINDESLLNKEIATNEKVTLDYFDSDDNKYNLILDDSPIIKLAEIQDTPIANPQTGSLNALLSIVSLIGLISLLIYNKNRKNYIKKI